MSPFMYAELRYENFHKKYLEVFLSKKYSLY